MNIEQAILWACNALLAMTLITGEKEAEKQLFQDLSFFQEHQQHGHPNKQFSR